MGEEYNITQCPVCHKNNLKRILVHISKSKSCKSKCSNAVLEELRKKSSQTTLSKKKELMKIKRNQEEYKKNENEKIKKIMKEKRKDVEYKKNENEKMKKKIKEMRNDTEYKKKEIERNMENKNLNYEKHKNDEKARIKIFREKQRENDEQKLMEKNRDMKRNSRRNETENQRLKVFLQATMHNAVFICTCCHIRSFQSNVLQFTNSLKEKISSKYPNILKMCLNIKCPILSNFQTQHPQEKWPDYYRDDEKSMRKEFICKTCLKYLGNNKMPPSCVKNGLEIHESYEELKADDLILTDLEGALIARSILFMKIFQLPTSRWTGMIDKAVNVPIPESSVLNTLEKLPRTPIDAGLISVNLKRKEEYKNTHISQLINPKKIFKMLDNLKEKKNPHYKFYEDYSTFKERCMKNDPKGSKLLYKDCIEENLENIQTNEKFELLDELMDNEDSDSERYEESDIENEKNNDPAQKYNFNYDRNVCFTDKYQNTKILEDCKI